MSSHNYAELCRLCLVKERVSVPIFDGEGDIGRIFLKITACLPIKVSREDRLPKNICDDCLYKVENQYSFWNSTANAEKQLLHWYGLDSLQDDQKIVPTNTNMETEQLDLKQEAVDLDQGSELAKSLSRVEAVLAEEAGRTTANTEEEEEEEDSEEGSNSEESEDEDDNENDNDADADEPSKDDPESDENYEELEPTTFVNVSLACDEAGPSGMQQQQTSAPSTSTSGPAASGSAINAHRHSDNRRTSMSVKRNKAGCPTQDNIPDANFPSLGDPKSSITDISLITSVENGAAVFNAEDLSDRTSVPRSCFETSSSFVGNIKSSSSIQNERTVIATSSFLVTSDHLCNNILICANSSLDPNSDSCSDPKVPYSCADILYCTSEVTITTSDANPSDSIPITGSGSLITPCNSPATSDSYTVINDSQRSIDEEILSQATSDDLVVGNDFCDNIQGNCNLSKAISHSSTLNSITASNNQLLFPSGNNVVSMPVHSSEKTENRDPEISMSPDNADTADILHLKSSENHLSASKKENLVMKTSEKETNNSPPIFLIVNNCAVTRTTLSANEPSIPNPLQCTFCSKLFLTFSRLDRHLVTHSDNRPFSCDICSKTFKRSHELKIHGKIHTKDKSYICEMCGHSFTQKHHLTIHRRRHLQDYKYICPFCMKGFHSNDELQSHKNTQHNQNQFVCNVCRRSFANKKNLSKHQRLHDPNFIPEKKHQCEICGKAFSKKSGLCAHLMTHTGENCFVCDSCGKTVTSKDSLKAHQKIHTGEKEFVCDVCGKAFRIHENLRVHLRTHTGEKPFSCDVCSRSFSQRSSLTLHKLYHSGKRPFQCEMCGCGFVSKSLLRTHYLNVHGKCP